MADEKQQNAPKSYVLIPFDENESQETPTDRTEAKEQAYKEHRRRNTPEIVSTHIEEKISTCIQDENKSDIQLQIAKIYEQLQQLNVSISEDDNDSKKLSQIKEELDKTNSLILTLIDTQKQVINDSPRSQSIDNLSKAISELNQNSIYFSEKITYVKKESLEYCKRIIPKIISREVSTNSELIIESGFNLIFSEIKSAAQITIHLNNIDYNLLKEKISSTVSGHSADTILKIESSDTISRGDFLLLSDQGNFDINLLQKTKLVLESIIN